jgi:hypothetical protein
LRDKPRQRKREVIEMSRLENAIEILNNNNIAYTIKYNVGVNYEVNIIFDELGYMPSFKKIYDYNTGKLIK